MSGLTKTCLCLLALISSASLGAAQSPAPPPPPTPVSDKVKEKLRRELEQERQEEELRQEAERLRGEQAARGDVGFVRVSPRWVTLKTAGGAKVVFNYETMRKKAFVTLPKVAAAPGEGIDLTASFFFEGGAAKPSEGGPFKPLWFNVEFTADRGSFGQSSNREVAVESDGRRLALGDALEQPPESGDAARVVLKKSVVYESFVRAFGGRNVTVHLGSFSFKVGDAELKAVRDLIKLTEEAPR